MDMWYQSVSAKPFSILFPHQIFGSSASTSALSMVLEVPEISAIAWRRNVWVQERSKHHQTVTTKSCTKRPRDQEIHQEIHCHFTWNQVYQELKLFRGYGNVLDGRKIVRQTRYWLFQKYVCMIDLYHLYLLFDNHGFKLRIQVLEIQVWYGVDLESTQTGRIVQNT